MTGTMARSKVQEALAGATQKEERSLYPEAPSLPEAQIPALSPGELHLTSVRHMGMGGSDLPRGRRLCLPVWMLRGCLERVETGVETAVV